MGLYLDLAAAMDFLAHKGIMPYDVIAHGSSLGGAVASAAGYFYGTHVTLDQTFSSGRQIIEDLGKEYFSSLPRSLLKGVARGSFPLGGTYALPPEQQRRLLRPLHTDGLDTLQKLSHCPGQVCVIRALHDGLIPAKCADEMIYARYGDSSITHSGDEQHLVQVKGSHVVSFLGWQGKPTERYLRHLQAVGLLKDEVTQSSLISLSSFLEGDVSQRERESGCD